MRAMRLLVFVLLAASAILACGESRDNDVSGDGTLAGGGALAEAGSVGLRTVRTGGMGTAIDSSERAFSLTARNINHGERQAFADGKAIFERSWTAPVTDDFGGLGPHFAADSCASCHADDGRAAAPTASGPLPTGFTVRLDSDDPATVDHYGASLSPAAIDGTPEAVVSVAYEEIEGTFDDGERYSLRRPIYEVDTGDGPALPEDAVVGVRLAPQLPGLGLLEMIPVDQLLLRADPDDADGDGISGRLGVAEDLFLGQPAVGRFGWNATQPTVEQQTASALFADMGLTSRYFPVAACDRWAPCPRAGTASTAGDSVTDYGDREPRVPAGPIDTEVSDRRLHELTVYTQTLAVPAPRKLGDPEVERGWELFGTTGCGSCHAGPYTTGRGPIQGLSNQVIQPYTDLLVHDLGAGLADQTIGGEPVTTQWRTPPLWGIGLLATVSGHTDLLHDGRARTFEEAILWHGGEAAASAAAYRGLGAGDRAALVTFLESL